MCWVKEIQQPRVQNCLKDDIAFWELWLKHRQVEELMEAADVEQSVKYHTLAVDLRNACAGQVPRCVDCAQRHHEKTKQFAEEDYCLAEYDQSRGSTLLIRSM